MARPTRFEQYQEELRRKRWTWEDVALFHDRSSSDQSIVPFHQLDYLDAYERTYGRRIGANGIGRLREVGLSRITAAEDAIYESGSYGRDLLEAHGAGRTGFGRLAGIDACRAQQEQYAAALDAADVAIHWIDWGEQPVSAYGPMHGMWAASELMVVNGGAIVPKRGRDPFSFGRGEWLSRWAFWELNIPTLITIAGRGIAEAGSAVWLAQDVLVVGDSIAYNEDGLEQMLPVVERTSGVDELHVVTVHCQGERYFDPATGSAAHVNNLIAPLDLDKVLCYTPGVDTAALLWLQERGYEIVPVGLDDHARHKACNLTVLEPGRVIMAAEAETTVARVREAGVDVVTVPYAGFHAAGGGLHTATLQINRDPGPSRF